MVKIDIAAVIWDTLRPTAEELPVTEEQRRIIDRRLEEHRRDPDSAIPWEQVKARIESE